MAELSGSELLREWQRLMNSVISQAASLAGATRVPQDLVAAMQRQLELMREIIDRERDLQRQVADRLLAPIDAVFDLLEGSGHAMRSQAEALQAAGAALEESASLMREQAALFESTIASLRQPAELARAAAGAARQERSAADATTAGSDEEPGPERV